MIRLFLISDQGRNYCPKQPSGKDLQRQKLPKLCGDRAVQRNAASGEPRLGARHASASRYKKRRAAILFTKGFTLRWQPNASCYMQVPKDFYNRTGTVEPFARLVVLIRLLFRLELKVDHICPGHHVRLERRF